MRAWLSTLPGSLRLLLFGCVTFACAREAPSVFVNQPVSPAPAPPVAASAAPAPPAPNPPKSSLANRSDALAERYGAAPPLAVFKGEASYYSVEVKGETNKDAAWFYPEPKEAAANIRGYIAFWRGVSVENS